jgi:FKBP-type peptidyl-prolyl cis-trans isomerase 2/predicted negative regulator of RcsB-dependent stress response
MERTNKMAPARFGDKVKVNFTCKLEDGTIFDSSTGRESLQFTIGKGEVFPGLEEAVIGMHLNESKHIKIPPDKAFGSRLKEKVQVISQDQFPEDLKPEVGLQFQIQQADGQTSTITITDVTESSVTLDANHPLAGKDLSLDIELIEIEETNISKAHDYYDQGITFQDRGQQDEAIQSYQKAIELNPGFAPAYYNLGVAFHKKGQPDQAILCYQLATGFNPNYAEAYHNLGIVLKEKGKLDEATTCFEVALQSKPTYAGAYYNLGNILVAKGKFDEALSYYRKTIDLNPDYAEAHWNIALINLLFGNFDRGWKGYEWRWKLEGVSAKRNFDQPLWDGSDIAGRTILLHAEQGLGDTIHFIRYAPLVAERGAKVIFECQKELVSLLEAVRGIYQVIERGAQLPEFDVHCPLLSLPLVFGTTLENIPSAVPYITINSSLIQKWQNKLLSDNSKLKIGLAWSGDMGMRDDQNRSCSLEIFSRLAGIDDITFYSLQKGEAAEQAKKPPEGMNLVDYTEEIYDFLDTAAFIENLDLVICVDTAVAHLAGAMGKPVWTLIPFVPDWRWMLDREDSPWYPTMKLFRQPDRGDWAPVIAKLSEELRTFSKNDIKTILKERT